VTPPPLADSFELDNGRFLAAITDACPDDPLS
jgi:hypothetical protein